MRLPKFKTGRFSFTLGSLLAASLLFLFNSNEYFLILLLSALIHETGHLIGYKICKERIGEINMTAAGLEIKGQDRLTSYRSDIIIALSGPVAGIGAALASFFIIKERLKHCQFSERETEMIFFFLSNSFYSAVNLLPVRGLDGGNALYALLASKCRLSTAERISFAVSAVFAAGTAVTALLIIGRSRFNYSLMVLSLSLLFELIPKKT